MASLGLNELNNVSKGNLAYILYIEFCRTIHIHANLTGLKECTEARILPLSLAEPEAVSFTTPGAAIDENFIIMATF